MKKNECSYNSCCWGSSFIFGKTWLKRFLFNKCGKPPETLDTHSFAVLIGVGATTINPYLAIDSIYQRYEKKLYGNLNFDECTKRFKKAIENGLLKIMSKMGISVLSSYRGGCNFESVGLSRAVVSEYFPGMVSRISGIGLIGIEEKIKKLHQKAYSKNLFILPIGGIYKYRKTGEQHQIQGNLIHILQNAVTTGSYETYKKYSKAITCSLTPINLRDLLEFKKAKQSLNLDEVEPIEEITKKDLEVEVCLMELYQRKPMKL